jgi:Na+/phosphate symporter
MAKNNKEVITLEVLNDSLGNLANMVAKGFDDIEKNMVTKEEFNTRIGSLEKKVNKLDFQVDEVYDILKRFEENDILNLQKRVFTLEKAVRALAANQSPK